MSPTGIGKFYENLDRGIYNEVFSSGVSGYYVYNCVKVVRAIEIILKNKIDGLVYHMGKDMGC